MKRLALPTLLAASLAVAGCASLLSGQVPVIDQAYTTENPQGAGVVQVFDIGANTVIQVRNIDTMRPTIVDAAGDTLKYAIFGQNAVLEGRHSIIRVVTLNGTSLIKRNAAAATAKTTHATTVAPAIATEPAPAAIKASSSEENSAPAAVPAPVLPVDAMGKHNDESPAALQAEIERMRKELAEIKVLLNRAVTHGMDRPADAPQNPSPSIQKPSTVIVEFADNSHQFTPTPVDRTTIRELARTATQLNVEGFTDSFTANRHAKDLATLRAYAAKEYLVSEGVNPAKITVKVTPAGGFIADNHTKQGKAANRRVEITMHYTRADRG